MNKSDTTEIGPVDMQAYLAGMDSNHACLIVIYGPNLGRKIILDKDVTSIGRSEEADFQIDEKNVSRKHAIIKKGADGQFLIEDLDSTNGTLVNTKHTESAVLQNQDVINVGNTIFKFILSDSLENAYHEELYRLATTDSFLKVYNKQYCLERLRDEVSSCRRHDKDLSIIMIDIDHFKRINDNYGHRAGDGVLQQLADIMKAGLRQEDMLCRFGGDEFVIILPESDVQQAAVVAERLRTSVEETAFRLDDAEISVTISIGVSAYAVLPDDVLSIETLIDNADKALYQAKKAGRNRIVRCDDMRGFADDDELP